MVTVPARTSTPTAMDPAPRATAATRPRIRGRGVTAPRSRFLGLALLALAACTTSAPSTRPAPEPTSPVPETPVEEPTRPARTLAFEYGTGSSQYLIESMAVVTLSADSIAPTTDSVQVTATAMIAISAGGFARSVAGTIYDSALEEGALIRQPGPGSGSRAGGPEVISFLGELTPGRTTLEVAPEGDDPGAGPEVCDAAAATASMLVGLAREAIPPIPDSVHIGAIWHDSVAIPSCRSGVHLVTSARHEYHLVELQEEGDTTVALIRRQTTSRVDGAGTQSRLPVTVSGVGAGSSDLWLDLTHGRVIAHEARSTLTLQHTAGSRTVTMEQESTISVRLSGTE